MLMERHRAAELGRQTVDILEAGRYTVAEGQVVEIGKLVMSAVAGTRSYPPDCDVPPPQAGRYATSIEVSNESTLTAARKLLAAGYRPAALNFASAKHPGGGFLSGARAQEESLARSTALYACLNGNDMYEFHRARRDAIYADYVIYSPDVPVNEPPQSSRAVRGLRSQQLGEPTKRFFRPSQNSQRQSCPQVPIRRSAFHRFYSTAARP